MITRAPPDRPGGGSEPNPRHADPRPVPQELDALHSPLQKAGLTFGVFALAALVGMHFVHGQQAAPPQAAVAASGASGAGPQAAGDTAPQIATQLAMIAPEHAADAVSHAHLSHADRQSLLAAVRRGDMKLATLPMFDVAAITGHAVHGHSITIRSGDFTQTVAIGAKPDLIILPIPVSGEIAITPASVPDGAGMTVGIAPLNGAMELPTFSAMGQTVTLGVVVQ